jgi:hypothetical protein
LLRQSIELDFDSEAINKFLDLTGNTFIYFLSHYVFKYNDFVEYEYKNIKLDNIKCMLIKKFIEMREFISKIMSRMC